VGKLGRLPLPRDDRDFRLADILPDRGLATYKYWYRSLVLNQGNTGTCEGNAWTGWLADGPITHPSITALKDATAGEEYARQLYVEATGDTSLQEGAYTRQLLKVLVGRGLIGAYHAAASVDEIITTLLRVGPVCFGCDWYSSMDTVVNQYDNSYIFVDEASGVRGGHEFILDGINLSPGSGLPYVRMHNSWGVGWAHEGTARITLDDLRKLFVGDAFVATELVA
jgi:hypothetical protein